MKVDPRATLILLKSTVSLKLGKKMHKTPDLCMMLFST